MFGAAPHDNIIQSQAYVLFEKLFLINIYAWLLFRVARAARRNLVIKRTANIEMISQKDYKAKNTLQ